MHNNHHHHHRRRRRRRRRHHHHHHHHLLLQLLLKVFIFMRRNPGAGENGAEGVLGFLNIAMKDMATHACPHAFP